MVISEDKDAIEKMRFWASQARDKARHYQHSELGYNYRMSNISAAIGRGQLKVLNQRVRRKREIFELYKIGFSSNTWIKLMPAHTKDTSSNCWLSSIILSDSNKVIPLIEFLEQFNIETRPLWKPMHLQPFYENYDFIGDRTSDRLFNQGLCLPSDSKLINEDISFVISKVNYFFGL